MNDIPLVSIIIPCYNYGKYVEEAISSAKNQTYQNVEIILVNDASTDPLTKNVLKKVEGDTSVTVIHHEVNKGLPAARNTAINTSSGKYILPLDADDTIESTIVEKTMKILEETTDVGFVSVGMRYFGDVNFVHVPPPINFYKLLYHNNVSVTSLFRKIAWEQVGGYNESLTEGYEDWEFWINLAKHGWRCSCVEEPLFNYRKHGNSMITESKKKHHYIYNQIKNIHRDLYLPTKLSQMKYQWRVTKMKEPRLKYSNKSFRFQDNYQSK
ncbi:glycosyltransferase family 2 protein [Anaerobacillus alkaliphilus]|uniref:glycosyltransferase family 2 protein n=1 Tax=Anaerobacillus alkaliphilus TaxID=1548597 RepID=UPI00137600CB|nr:glycosyltransferase family 2 protein [Anaerobacillus alkaliphilus]